MKLEQAIRTKSKLPTEITPIVVMQFMEGWNCEDYNNAPAKFIENTRLYMSALAASRKGAALSVPQGPPEAFKRIMQRW